MAKTPAISQAAEAHTRNATFRGLGDSPGGTFLSEAADVSGDGLTIARNGINPNGNQEACVATIPGPDRVTLLALGAFVLAHRNLLCYVGCRSYKTHHGDRV